MLLIDACEGAALLARAERSIEPFERTAEALRQVVATAGRRSDPAGA